MARRRRNFRRASVKRYSAPMKLKKRSRRTTKRGLLSGDTGDVLGGALYGALQEPMDAYLSSKLQPFLGFAGGYSGNVARLATLWGIKKFIKNPTVRGLASKGMIAEGVDIGKQLAGNIGIAQVTSNAGTTTQIFSTL